MVCKNYAKYSFAIFPHNEKHQREVDHFSYLTVHNIFPLHFKFQSQASDYTQHTYETKMTKKPTFTLLRNS
jgi:hypothetical protein